MVPFKGKYGISLKTNSSNFAGPTRIDPSVRSVNFLDPQLQGPGQCSSPVAFYINVTSSTSPSVPVSDPNFQPFPTSPQPCNTNCTELGQCSAGVAVAYQNPSRAIMTTVQSSPGPSNTSTCTAPPHQPSPGNLPGTL